MKSLFFSVCLCAIAANVIGQSFDEPNENQKRTNSQTEHENGTFIEELTDVALRAIGSYSEYGHKLIRVKEIGNVSRASVQNTMKVWACRFNDINQRKEIEAHPENNVTHNDFEICDVCQVQVNRTENGTYSAVETACDSIFIDNFATKDDVKAAITAITAIQRVENYWIKYLCGQPKGKKNYVQNRIKRQTEQENGAFIKELTDVALKAIEPLSEYGHKLIDVEQIGNVSRASDRITIKVHACRINDVNQKKEMEARPENEFTSKDFNVCDSCKFKMNKTENGTYSAVEHMCIL